MSDQQPPIDGAPPQAPGAAPADPQEDPTREINPLIETELEAAIIRCGRMAQTSDNAQEVKDFGQAAMQLAQALVISNPNLVAPDGVPIDALHPPKALAQVNPDAQSAQVVAGAPRVAKKPAAQ